MLSAADRIPAGTTREALEAELYSRSLRRFAGAAWQILERRTPYVSSWHTDAICDHLEACSRGEILQLLITMPPRMGKSRHVSVLWPAWEWTSNPSTRWLTASYAQQLATRDSVETRQLVESAWYQARWGHRVRIRDDQNQKTRYHTTETGGRLAIGTGGATGEGGTRVILDDPHDVRNIESERQRLETVRWTNEALGTRLDTALSCTVVVMQRTHEADVAGELLAQGGWTHLNLPMRYEGRVCVHAGPHDCSSASETPLGFTDPRTEPGELLEPIRWPEKRVADLERRIGSHATAGQLQQRPAPREGGLFPVERIGVVHERPGTVVAACRFWDKAATEGGGAYTAGVLVERLEGGRFLIADVMRGQWSPGVREATMRQVAATEPHVRIRHEPEPGSAGVTDAQATNRGLAGYDVRAVPATGSKETRALPLARQVEAGNVSILAGDWNRALLDELRVWPFGRYRDQGDAAAGAFNEIAVDDGAWI